MNLTRPFKYAADKNYVVVGISEYYISGLGAVRIGEKHQTDISILFNISQNPTVKQVTFLMRDAEGDVRKVDFAAGELK